MAKFKDGAFLYTTTSNEASSSIRFQTVGWYIHTQPTCASSGAYGGEVQCDPTSLPSNQRIKLQDNGGGHVKSETIVDGIVTTNFEWTKAEVLAAIGQAKAEQVISEGTPLYASAIMRVVTGSRTNPIQVSGPYHTLYDIKHSESWAHPEDLRQYFDVTVPFQGENYPVNMILKLSNGIVVSDQLIGNYKAGYNIVKSFPLTVQYEGEEYQINQSWLSPILRPSDQLYIQSKASNDPSLVQRNFKVYVGGVKMVASYKKVGGPPTEGEGSGECKYTIDPPNKIAAPQTSFMEPDANGAILGDDTANGRHFDAPVGIPTSENLFSNVWGKNYLFEHTFANMAGQIRYSCSVKVTYPTKWEEAQPNLPGPNGTSIPQAPLPKTGKFDKTYTFDLTPKEYTYWQVDQLAVYQIDRAQMENYALPGGEVTLYPNNYGSPTLELTNSTEVEDHVVPQDTGGIEFKPEVVDGGDHEPGPDDVDDTDVLTDLAEMQTKDPEVQNDRLVFNGETIMDDTVANKTGPTPGRIPDPQIIGDEVLYEGQLMINSGLLNRQNTTSTGTIYYTMLSENVEGNGDQEFLISPINSVTVHTPVVNYSLLPDDNRPFDQRMTPDMTRAVLILDRPFTIHFTESGQHLNIPGYGNRDYAKYTKNKRIQFPFGVFQGSQYYPENTWIYIPVGTQSMTFTMPTWVNEGDYTIYTQSWAINAPSDGSDLCEENLNGNLTNYCASESFNIGVVGRLFDFRIWDIGDFRFEKVFRTGVGTLEHSNTMYYTGGNDENGIPTALSGQPQWQLPIRKGSHPTEQRTVPHNGYSFLFDFRTIGNLWQPGEGIRIEPSFYFIPKNGGTATPVDLYYDISGSNNKMIGVGSSKDKLSYSRTYRLADGLRNISSGELSTAASYEYNYILSEAERENTSWLKFYQQYTKRKTKIATGYNLELLPYKSRTLVGPTDIPNGVNPIAAVRSVQHWYGEYNLPIAPYILHKGTDIVTLANHYGGALDGHEQEFITGGFILINFEIYTVKNGDADTRILGYKAPIANMWAIEGQMTGSTDEMGQTFSFSSGDIILFESDYSVRNDYQGQAK
ncbi:hypothetical protein BJP48_23820 [Paenibacillus odorifer]|nr:hypothetical protein BJP48_23820 [Paenibacillus odorifer]